jgi:hypothetical protein
MRKLPVSECVSLDGVFDADTMAQWFHPYDRKDRQARITALVPDVIEPSGSPAPSADPLARLEAAVRDLETDLTAASNGRRTHLDHPVFGHLRLADLPRLVMIHTQHHPPQLSPAQSN